MDIGVLVSQAFPYLGAVAGAYGGAVLQRLQDEATNSTVEVGRRLLDRLLGRDESRPAIEAAVTDLAEHPEDEDFQAAVRAQVRKALTADPELAAEIGRAAGRRRRPRHRQVHGHGHRLAGRADRRRQHPDQHLRRGPGVTGSRSRSRSAQPVRRPALRSQGQSLAAGRTPSLMRSHQRRCTRLTRHTSQTTMPPTDDAGNIGVRRCTSYTQSMGGRTSDDHDTDPPGTTRWPNSIRPDRVTARDRRSGQRGQVAGAGRVEAYPAVVRVAAGRAAPGRVGQVLPGQRLAVPRRRPRRDVTGRARAIPDRRGTRPAIRSAGSGTATRHRSPRRSNSALPDRVGSFLFLLGRPVFPAMATEVGSTLPRRQLGRYLRSGILSVRPSDVAAMCRLYRAPAEMTEALMGLARETRAKGWWHSYERLPGTPSPTPEATVGGLSR